MTVPLDATALVRRSRSLLLLQGVVASAIAQALLDLLAGFTEGEAGTAERYGTLFRFLAAETELSDRDLPGNPWQRHVVDRLLADDNPFSQKVRRAGVGAAGPALVDAVVHDLAILHDLAAIEPRAIANAVGAGTPAWTDLCPLPDATPCPSALHDVFQALLTADDWSTVLPALAAHYAERGSGLLHDYRAFRWRRDGGHGHLEGIAHPDTVQIDELVGDTFQRGLLRHNTEQFLAGFPANNVLLYGDRGTGKSSSVKALLQAYGDAGLRMIEVPKQGLDDFAEILSLLRTERERFILFVDDLSFEEHETHYKELKAILEGSLEARPANVLLYATSNRRHLITERFSDRVTPSDDDEVQAQDTVQEKLSLSDRFGLTLTFVTPTQEHYLAIVSALAARRGLCVAEEELRRRALQWATWHNGRSGRTARQFVDYLTGEAGLAAMDART